MLARRDHRHRGLRRRAHAVDEQPARRATSPAAAPCRGPGLVALDPVNGMPLSLEPRPQPARRRGVLAAGHRAGPLRRQRHRLDRQPHLLPRPKIAFFPLAGGAAPASTATAGSARQRLPGRLPEHRRRPTCSTGSTPAAAAIQSGDTGPDWAADSSDPSPYRNGGSNRRLEPGADRGRHGPGDHARCDLRQRALGAVGQPADAVDASRSRPARRSRSGSTSPTGAPCTSSPGQRVFNVAIDGTTVLRPLRHRRRRRRPDRHDEGVQHHQRRHRQHRLHAHQVENPLINGIEIIRTDVPAPPPAATGGLVDAQLRRHHRGPRRTPTTWRWTSAPCAARSRSATSCSTARPTATSTAAPSTGTTFGAEQLVDPYNDPAWSNVDTGSGQTFRGVRPVVLQRDPEPDRDVLRRHGQLYYTLFGDSTSTSARSARTAGSSTTTGSPPGARCRPSPGRSSPAATSTTRPARTGTCPRSRSPAAPSAARPRW